MGSEYAYLFLLLAGSTGISVIFLSDTRRRYRYRRQFYLRAAVLFCVWFGVDHLALHFDAWRFPPTGTLPFRPLGLPLEEFVLFYLHSVATILTLDHFSEDHL